MTSRRFQVQSDKTINDPNGNRFRGVGVQLFMDGVGVESSTAGTGGSWAIRPNNPLGVTVSSGKSPPTGNVPHTFRNFAYMEAVVQEYVSRGVNMFRIGVDRAWLNTEGYFYDGNFYPADHKFVDHMVDLCGRYGCLLNITCVANYAPLAVKIALAEEVATRYKRHGHVAINPSNEINCGLGTGTCANTTTWLSDMSSIISAIRATGSKNLLIINGVGSGDQSSSFDMRPMATILAGSPFNTDPNWVFGIHHYRYIGGASTGWGSTEINQEDLEWGQYLGTFPIMIEETGIHTDVVTNYDPDLYEPGGSSANITQWNYAKAHWQGFLGYCRGQMDSDKLSAVCVLGDAFYNPSNGFNSDLNVRRNDGSITASGNIALEALLDDSALTPPILVSSVPSDAATGVLVGDNIVLNFSKNMQAGTGNIVITDITGSGADTRTIAIGDGQVSISGSQIIINPTTNLSGSNQYRITMASGVCEDTNGNDFAGISSGDLDFTTGVPDVTAPTLSSFSPSDGANGVTIGSNIVLTFNENVQAGTGNIVLTDLTSGTDNRNFAVGGSEVSISGAVVTINPSTDLQNSKHYQVTISSGVIKDLAGNDFAGISAGNLDFNTEAAWTTIVTNTLGGAGGVDVNGWNVRNTTGSLFSQSYSQLRITLKANPSYNLSFGSAYVGVKASSGDVYDATNLVQMQSSGNNSFSIPAGQSLVLDPVNLSVNSGDQLVFSYGHNGASRSNIETKTGWTAATSNGGAANSGTANVSGYTTDANFAVNVLKIEAR